MRAWLAALVLLAAAAAPLRAAETMAVPTSVPVRDGLHEGYGRLVFDWPREVGYEAHVDDGRLVIAFDAPAAFEGPVMQRGLKGYAAAPQVAGDGRRLTLPLSGPVTLKHFRLGPKVVIDLQQAAAVPAEAAAKTQAADAAAEALPRVRVRAGRHQGFSRLVFDWEAPVGELLEEAPGRARLLFDRQAEFDLSGVDAARLPQIAGISAMSDGVTLELSPGSRLKVERSGTKVVLDVIGDAAATEAAAPRKPAASEARPVEDLTPRVEATPALEVAAEAAPAPSTPAPAAPAPTEPMASAEPAPSSSPSSAEGPTPLVPQAMGGTAAAPPPAAAA
ncbi:MAG TPA: hypothetical protein VKP12_10790, partial [Kiloniellaceae bacterium]|nr:hypothetical protein [Kiloniellaceae bacterium]